ncbi:hypothetical protein BE221DRAFT_203235 [Ostreococcus tauri]|uniref:CSC1/OSCA1-like cytosolic domain-containing protein n=1 Tax=Ostreococcus tauri TaxID=70448 RepID=A0A1Y5IH92_OSTTA|nr:hypothetical protein BE221DRAFT_203235 [Ostreococcus tauri]
MDAADPDLASAREFQVALDAVRVSGASAREGAAGERSPTHASSFDAFRDFVATRGDLTRALAVGARARVYEVDVDSRTGVVRASDRRFNALASHRSIGASNVSLALYLDSAMHFGFLMLILCAVSMYSMVKNVSDEKFTSSYEIRGWNGTVTCERSYDTSGLVLSLSQGSRCAIGAQESYYNCPMACSYADTSGTFDPTNACSTHYPCTLKNLLTDAQDALCCEPQLLNNNAGAPEEFQAISIVVTIVFLLFDFVYSRNRRTVSDIVIESTVTTGDYSVIVSGLGKRNEWTREQLAKWFAHYGEVVSVCHLTNTAGIVALEKKIQELVKIKNEIDATLSTHELADEEVDATTRARRFLFRMIVLRGMKPTLENSEKLRTEIEKLQQKLISLPEYGNFNTGTAIVTFNYEQHALNCIADHCSDASELMLAKATRKFPPDFYGRRLIVARAPEPSDINWQNLRSRNHAWENAVIWISTKLILAVAIAAGGGLQYLFEYLRSKQFDKLSDELAISSSYSTSTYIKLQLMASATSLVVVSINFALDALTVRLSDWEVYNTQTSKTNWLMAQLTIVNLVNYVIIPIVSNRCSNTADGVCNWYVPGGFIEVAFYMQVFNVIAMPFRIFTPNSVIRRDVLAPLAKTLQVQVDLVNPPDFGMARSYAELLKTVGFAAIYAPALPASYIVGFVGVFVLYWCKKFQGLYIARAPPKLRADAFGITATARIINLLQIIIGCTVFYRFDAGIDNTLWANLGIWAVGIIPIRTIMKLFFVAQAARAASTNNVSFEKNLGMHIGGEVRSPKADDALRSSATIPRERGDVATAETRAQQVRNAFVCRMYRCEPEDLEERVKLLMYYPDVPTHATPEQLEGLLKKYEPLQKIERANTAYLERQTAATGGEHARPPDNKHAKAKLDILASFQRRQRASQADEEDKIQ